MSGSELPEGIRGVVPVARMAGPDAAATEQFGRWLDAAAAYVRAQEGAPPIAETWFGLGVADLVCVFLFRLEPGDVAWVIAGDVPTAWVPADEAKDPVAALEAYCALAQQWIDAVRAGDPSSAFPLGAPADEAHAAALEARVRVLRDEVLPACRGAA